MIFNTECENAIDKVSFSNYESMKKRIDRAYEKLNKLNRVLDISISESFLQLKHTELTLAYEYARKKQEEKEYIREQREIEKENARVQKELEAERQRIAKEQAHYNNVLTRLLDQLNEPGIGDEKKLVLQEKINDVTQRIPIQVKKIATSLEDPFFVNPQESLKRAIEDYSLRKAWTFPNVLGIHVEGYL